MPRKIEFHTNQKINEIRNAKLLLGNLITQKELALAYSVTASNISSVLNNKSWME